VGEEAEMSGPIYIREVGEVAAPLNTTEAAFQPGETIRLDVVVRTKAIGHFFPGGTVDSFDIWLELEGKDRNGKHIFWSGRVEDDGKGPVEKGAHFYKSYMLDGEGNEINKRNAWQARAALYVRLIPPGAADVAHYRVKLPEDVEGPVTFTAKLNHRKFTHYYTQFSYAGEPVPGQDASRVSLAHDGREYSFDPKNIPANVSGKIKDHIPVLPIVVLAKDEVQLQIAEPGEETEWQAQLAAEDYLRWNDWGIGMLLQGDLKGAEYAFKRVMEANPTYADGPLNVARALIQEGETDTARPYVEKALALDNSLARVHFFRAMIQKAEGDYDGAIESLRRAELDFPKDRVVLNQLGRLYFLKRNYRMSIRMLERVLGVDPEDVQAHYTMMLAYRGQGDTEKAERAEKLFRRFKADEDSQEITLNPRKLSPEANNARQPIHDHVGIPLDEINRPSDTISGNPDGSRPATPKPATPSDAPAHTAQ
jgi:tetratricopeptide (TPR) repeat protein